MLISRLLSGRSKSGTTTGPTAGNWWQPFNDAGILGNETTSGEQVAPEIALNYHAWFRAMSLIAQKCAVVPKHLLRRTTDGDIEGKERARDHPVYSLINDRANEEQTAFQFWLQMFGHVPSRGNAYAVIYRVSGKPVELLPMDPDRTYVLRKDGALWYVVYPFGVLSGDGIRMKPADVLHFKGWGYDGLVGYPIWKLAADEIGLGRAERKLSGTRFKNGARPSLVLQTDSKLDNTARLRLREDWERMQVGVNNAWRTAILDNGLKAQPISLNAEELGQSDAAQMSLTAISNFTGVPSSKLGASGKSYASQEQEDRAFINDGLDFYLSSGEDETGFKLLTDAERADGYEVKANREALLRPDIKAKHEAARIALAGKPWKTQNEVRKDFDMIPLDEPTANELGTPLNIGQGGIDNNPNDPAGNDPGRPTNDNGDPSSDQPDPMNAKDQRAAAEAAITASTRKLVRRVAFHANRLSNRPDEFLAFVDSMQAKHERVFIEEMSPAEQMARAFQPEAVKAANPKGYAGRVLLETIHGQLAALAQSTPAKSLPEKVAALAADQEKRLPREFIKALLGDCP